MKTRSVLIHIDFCCDFTWIVGSAMDEGIPEVGELLVAMTLYASLSTSWIEPMDGQRWIRGMEVVIV